MAEYITKETVLQAFEWGDVDVFEDCGGGYISGFSRDAIKNTINSIPAADVTPMVHGKWVTTSGEVFPGSSQFLCYSHKHEECGFQYVGMYDNEYDYCPKCGAKMEGGAE